MSRVYIASEWKSIPSERADSRKHENRPGLGCEGLLSSRTLRCWNHGRISVSRQNSFFGSNCERNYQIRNRSVRNYFSWKRWAGCYRETCCEGLATTKACCDIVSSLYSYSWKKMDRHQSRKIHEDCFAVSQRHDQIAATWFINSSKRWWCSAIWWPYGRSQGKVWKYFALVK